MFLDMPVVDMNFIIAKMAESCDDPSSISEVHSANSWENAELGDDDRKKKFLKLMGASKKKHEGRFVIGDHHHAEHCRTKEENDALTQKIEGLYSRGLQHKLTGAARRHTGLGFHPEDAPSTQDNTDGRNIESDGGVVDGASHQTRSPLIGFCKAAAFTEDSIEVGDDAVSCATNNGSSKTHDELKESKGSIDSCDTRLLGGDEYEISSGKNKCISRGDKTTEKRQADSTSGEGTKAKVSKIE